MSVTGEREGEPMKVAVAIADLMTGMYSTVAILAALRHRDAAGEGQHIDMALLDTQVAWLANLGQGYLTSGELPARLVCRGVDGILRPEARLRITDRDELAVAALRDPVDPGRNDDAFLPRLAPTVQ